MNTLQVQCNFDTAGGKTFCLRLNDVKEDLDTAAVAKAMDQLVSQKLFGREDPIIGKKSAYLVRTEKTTLI